MKNQQQQAARELYFNSNLNKTEIAERLSVSRRSIYQWSVDGDWEKLRQSARHMPAILAEKVYYIFGHLTDQLLSADSSEIAISRQDVDMLHKLTLVVSKLKKGSTVADNMETFNFLLERIHRKDPALAHQVVPHVEEYITDRRGKDEHSFLLNGFDETGHLPFSEKETEEKLLDEEEAAAILAEQNQEQSSQPATLQTKQNTVAPLSSKPVQSAQVPKTHTNTYTSSKPRPVHMPAFASQAAPPVRECVAAEAA